MYRLKKLIVYKRDMIDFGIYVLNNWRLFQILLEISFLLFMKIWRVKKFNSKFSGTAIEAFWWKEVRRVEHKSRLHFEPQVHMLDLLSHMLFLTLDLIIGLYDKNVIVIWFEEKVNIWMKPFILFEKVTFLTECHYQTSTHGDRITDFNYVLLDIWDILVDNFYWRNFFLRMFWRTLLTYK